MATEPTIDYDRSVLGKEVSGETIIIDREKVLAYAAAIGETNPLFLDDEAAVQAGYKALMAPPSYINALILSSDRPDPKVNFGSLSFHSGQAIETYLPIYAEDAISTTSSLEEVYAKTGRSGTMVFIVWKTELFNQDGALVAIARESFVRR